MDRIEEVKKLLDDQDAIIMGRLSEIHDKDVIDAIVMKVKLEIELHDLQRK